MRHPRKRDTTRKGVTWWIFLCVGGFLVIYVFILSNVLQTVMEGPSRSPGAKEDELASPKSSKVSSSPITAEVVAQDDEDLFEEIRPGPKKLARTDHNEVELLLHVNKQSSEIVPTNALYPPPPIVSPSMQPPKEGTGVKKKEVLVVVWNSVEGFVDYLKEPMESDCPVHCTWTESHRFLKDAAGIVFHPPSYRQRDPPRKEGQKWVMFTLEQDMYYPIQMDAAFRAKFDWKMTFHLNSDVPLTYVDPLWQLHPDHYFRETVPYFMRSSRYRKIIFSEDPGVPSGVTEVPDDPSAALATAFISNCGGGGRGAGGGSARRHDLFLELQQYIKIDSFGSCEKNAELPEEALLETEPNIRAKQKVATLRRYPFHLAWENNNKTDYVTEKFYQIFVGGTLGVYMGAESIEAFAPAPHSFLNVNDYRDMKHLAEHMLYLHQHPKEYAKFFEWKKAPLSDSFVRLLNLSCYNMHGPCRLCQKLAGMEPERPLILPNYEDLKKKRR